MKLDKNPHNHKLTDLLKVCIFSLLMLAPLFASVSQMLYATFNKNAKDSYSNQYVETVVKLDSSNINSLYVDGQYITYTFTEHNTQWNSAFGFSSISIDLNELFNVQTNWNKFYLYKDSQDILFYTTNNTTYRLNANDRNFNTFTYQVDLSVSTDKEIYNYGIANIFTFTTEKLDNAFYYGVKKMTESDLFNWTQNTAVYSGIKTMTDNLEIQTPAIAILITYWFILTIIYVIIDIVLKGFTYITHLIVKSE